MTHLRCPPKKEGPQPPSPEERAASAAADQLRAWAVQEVSALRVSYVVEIANHPTTVLARFPFLSETEREELGIVCRAVRDALEPTREA